MAYDYKAFQAAARGGGQTYDPTKPRGGLGGFQGGLGGVWDSVSGWWNKKNAPQIGPNPYQGNWDALIAQLQQSSRGEGPSLAEGQYRQAHARGLQDVLSMSRGGSATRARAGALQLGNMSTGLAQGAAQARLAEQQAAMSTLQAALAGAGNAWFAPQAANMQAMMNTKSNGQKLMDFAQQAAGTFASMAGGGGASGAAQPYQAYQAAPGYSRGTTIQPVYNYEEDFLNSGGVGSGGYGYYGRGR